MRIFLLASVLLSLVTACATNQSAGRPTRGDTSALSIFPDQEVFAEVTVQKDGHAVLEKVRKVKNQSATLTFNFEKIDDDMMLSVENSTDSSLKYHIDAVDYKGNLHHTSSCPVMAGLNVVEMWPDKIREIRITNVHVVGTSEEGLCIY